MGDERTPLFREIAAQVTQGREREEEDASGGREGMIPSRTLHKGGAYGDIALRPVSAPAFPGQGVRGE